MCPSTPKKTNTAPPSTGASTAPTAEWHLIDAPLSGGDAEAIIADHLTLQNYVVKPAGNRWQRYDLEIADSRWCKHPLSGFQDGRYEVKRLYRRTLTSSPDRRIKVGSRGETIYGRYDALIKAFALDVEGYLEVNWTAGAKGTLEIIDLIDAALERRHSKDFYRRLRILAEAYDDLYSLSSASNLLDNWGIQAEDIKRGFHDLDGVFVVVNGAAGCYFTLVSRKDIPRYFEFDSVSVEGVKLRYVGEAPSET